MGTPELIWRLRVEGGFALTPLIDSTGAVTGAHLTRFSPDGHVEVLQIWDERWAAFARIPDHVNPDAPLAAKSDEARSGRLADIAARLLNAPSLQSHGIANPPVEGTSAP